MMLGTLVTHVAKDKVKPYAKTINKYWSQKNATTVTNKNCILGKKRIFLIISWLKKETIMKVRKHLKLNDMLYTNICGTYIYKWYGHSIFSTEYISCIYIAECSKNSLGKNYNLKCIY